MAEGCGDSLEVHVGKISKDNGSMANVLPELIRCPVHSCNAAWRSSHECNTHVVQNHHDTAEACAARKILDAQMCIALRAQIRVAPASGQAGITAALSDKIPLPTDLLDIQAFSTADQASMMAEDRGKQHKRSVEPWPCQVRSCRTSCSSSFDLDVHIIKKHKGSPEAKDATKRQRERMERVLVGARLEVAYSG